MIVTNEYLGDPRVEAESTALARHGIGVDIVAWDRSNEFGSEMTRDGVTVQWSKVPTGVEIGIRQALRVPLFWMDAVRKACQLEIDAVHAHDLDALPAAYCVSRMKGVPLIYDAHESYPDQQIDRLPDFAVYSLRCLEARLLRCCQAVITVGDRLAASLANRGAAQVHVVGNWKQRETFTFSPEEIAKTRHALKLDGAHLVISYAGALSEERSVVQLVEAIRGCPEVVAIVAGYGPAEKQIAELAQVVPNLRFLGKRDATDIPLITAVSDAVYYCLKNATGNSFYSAPNKLFEAMAAGKAIIAVRGAGEIGEIVAARDLGVLVNKPEPQALKEGLHELLNPEKLRRWQQNAARAYSETYSWERAEQGLIAVYETLWDGADG